MQNPKRITEWSFITEAIQVCSGLFAECRNVPSLVEDGQIAGHELEFSQLLSDSPGRTPLAQSIERCPGDREALFYLLDDIQATLRACLRIASDTPYSSIRPEPQARDGPRSSLNSHRRCDQDSSSNGSTTSDETSISENLTSAKFAHIRLSQAKSTLSHFLGFLTRHVERARNQLPDLGSRFRDVDKLYDERQHDELRRHLTTLVLVRPYHLALLNKLPGLGFTAVQIVARAWLTDVSRLNNVQVRLIDGVMIRRHRIMFATKDTHDRGQPSKDEEQNAPEASRSQHQKGLVTQDDSTFSNCSPVRLQPPPRNTSPQVTLTEPSATAAYSRIIAIQDYPPKPEFAAETTARNCPFCGNRLSDRELSSNTAWRSHVAYDLRPYTCILEKCKTPTEFFLTSSSWLRHMRDEHMSSVGSQLSSRLPPLNLDSSQRLELPKCPNLELMWCPICNDRLHSINIEYDDHIAEHIHSLSLRALPWDNGALCASSRIDSGAAAEGFVNGLASITNNAQPPPTMQSEIPPFPKDSKKPEQMDWVLEFVLLHDHSILPRHWDDVENFLSEYIMGDGRLSNQIRLYVTSDPEKVSVFRMTQRRRVSAAVQEIVTGLRGHDRTIGVVRIPSESALSPKTKNTKVENWINSTPLGPILGVAAALDAMSRICNDIKENWLEETSTVLILTSQDWPINTWTSALHGLVRLISHRAKRPHPAPIHIAFVMIGDKARVDNTAIFDLWTEVLKSSIYTSASNSTFAQEDQDGHIVNMLGRFSELEQPASAITAADPTDRAEDVVGLESLPSYRLLWSDVQEALKLIFPSRDFGDICMVQRDERYYFSMLERLRTSEKNLIWHIARSVRNGKRNQARAKDKPMFQDVIYLGIAPPPDGPIHLGSIVSSTTWFQPLGSGADHADRPPKAYTTGQQQDITMQISDPRTGEHLELHAKQLSKILFKPSSGAKRGMNVLSSTW
ncbi:hypothetical protein O1611_g5513 [Lasiodiplodia mahajangana]|uniref:Uncharacterized protein n=1 Tax=Lasiodiplodia mahajangana TaxID=1108764 RepID=A0ACC2JLS4_9PEZI|nr:hypothetical protein O1611_g5513 [Lasiodiplodia mahajangana]